jgi:hypothetical protein
LLVHVGFDIGKDRIVAMLRWGRAAHPGRETQHTVWSTLKGLDKGSLTWAYRVLVQPFQGRGGGW